MPKDATEKSMRGLDIIIEFHRNNTIDTCVAILSCFMRIGINFFDYIPVVGGVFSGMTVHVLHHRMRIRERVF